VGRHHAPPDLLANDEGFYEPIRADFVSPEGYVSTDGDEAVDRHNCAWGEANGDGQPDLYCAQGADHGFGTGPNQLLFRRGKTFVDRARRWGVSDELGRGRSVNWIDYDGDGDLDLFVGNLDRPGAPNVMFQNRGGRFRRVDVGLGRELSTVSSSWADWDVDGDPDLMVLQYPPNGVIAYLNEGGSYRRARIEGITGKPLHAVAWGDYDGDGRSDVALMSLSRLRIFRNLENGFHEIYRRRVRDGRMAVWLDAENDGDLDLVVILGSHPNGSNQPDFLLAFEADGFLEQELPSLRGPRGGGGDAVASADHDRNGLIDLFVTNGARFLGGDDPGRDQLLANVSSGGHWIAIDLVGDPRNPWGMGSRIRVDTGARVFWRELTDGVTYRSQSEVGHQVLGIGSEVTAEVRITWPDGTSDCIDMRAEQTVSVVKGSRGCELG
jgi:hypothetical protein